MENKKAPSLQFYPKDALDIKVIRMSDAAQGVYWRLLFNIWSHTNTQYSIKNCKKSLSKILGLSSIKWNKYYKEIQQEDDPIFIEENGMLVSKRLRIEKIKQNEWREKSRQGGIKSAEKRARMVQPPLQPPLQPIDQPTGNTSSSSSSSLKKKEKNKDIKISKKEITKPDSVSQQIWDDFKIHRKSKKAPITETAMNGIIREAKTAKYSLNNAIKEIVERNWISFKADWVNNGVPKKQGKINYG